MTASMVSDLVHGVRPSFKLFADSFDVEDNRLGALGPSEKNGN
jgi:hypothetical protein